MNKLIIFDLDGVLIDSRELHYDALNDALLKVGKEYFITKDEHLSLYDGLNTTKKLEMLSEKKGLESKYYNDIWNNKQIATFDLIKKFGKSERLISMFQMIKENDIKIAVASNSIRETVKLSLMSIGVLEYRSEEHTSELQSH